jgi:hypothetical protein
MPTKIAETEASVVFRLQRWRMYAMILLGVVLVSQAPFIVGAALGRDEGVTMAAVLVVVIAVSIGGVGVWAVAYALRRLRAGDVAIAVGPSGLFDSILLPRTLPWTEVKRPALRYSGITGWRLMFDVDANAEERLRISARQRRVAAWWRAFGARAYRVHLFGTDGNLPRFRTALERYVAVERPSTFSRILGRE